jgi:hypothetical protein
VKMSFCRSHSLVAKRSIFYWWPFKMRLFLRVSGFQNSFFKAPAAFRSELIIL